MLALEQTAMEVVNKLLLNEKIPMSRLRKISLQWKESGGYYLPILDCEFLASDIPEDARWSDIPKEDLTCAECFERSSCQYVDDAYNTDGDCLRYK
jgi:hypothetical protein